MALMPSISNAQNWANIATVGTLNNNELCYTDGTDIICDAGLFVNGTAALEVSGTVSATAFVGDGSQLTGVTASSVTLAINDLTDGKYDGSSLFVGAGAGAVDDGSANNNVGVGRNALSLNTTGYNNSAFGRETLFKNETGINNTALGSQVLYENLSGSNNVGIGLNAMLKNSTGSRNIAIGRQALNYNTSGHSNVAVGAQASFGSLGLSTGSYNISIGEAANIALQSGNNNIAIGASTSVPSATGNNQLNIGNTIYGNLGTNHVAIGKYVDSNYELDVSGTIHADVVSATTFVGDGSQLTGLSSLWTDAGDYITRDGFRVYDPSATIDLSTSEGNMAFYHKGKAAFRVGKPYTDLSWDDASIGGGSVAFGTAIASGSGSFAWGVATVNGPTTASGGGDLALGSGAQTTGTNLWKMAIGVNAEATNSPGNTAFGPGAKALGGTGYYAAFAVGPGAIAESGEQVFALGYGAKANTGFRNIAVGHGVETSGSRSSVFGYGGTVSGDDSMMLSVGADASGTEITDTNTLAIMGATGGVGIGIVSPSAELEVLGTVSATAFVGDGSSLTNVLAMPAGNDGRLQFNNSGVMDGAPLAYNTTYDKFYARGGLNNYIVNHSTGGTYAGRMNIGTADPSTEEGVLHLAVAGYNNTADLKRMLGVVMIGNRDSVFDTTPIPMLEGSYLPGIGFAGHTTTSLGAETEMGATVHAVIDGTVSSGVLPTAIVVNTGTNSGNLQERLRISSDGYIGIGTVSPSSELEVSGTVKATEFVASSDRSLKENINPLESALENVLNLKGVSYNFKPETGLTQAPQIGLVAQEVKEVYPQVVNGEEGHMSVNYSALVSPLIEAVKELNAKVDQQQSIIEKQQQLIDALMEKK